MDRSFLHRPEVIAAAKKFVCIRLTSYEDESEKAFISTLVKGDVSNTAFAILSPDGKPALRGRGPGRGPSDLFKDAAHMATGMDALAEKHPVKNATGVPALPVTLNAKVGLAVAAGDNLPLVIVFADTVKRQQELEAKVATLAWNVEFAGHLIYATTSTLKDLPKVRGHTITDGVLFIEPDIFGVGGKVVKELAGHELEQQLAESMRDTISKYVPILKTRRELANLGLKEGIFYETGVPVSGKGEAADRERYKQRLEQKK